MEAVAQLVLDRVALITPALDEAMSAAILQAETRAQGFDHQRFPHTRPLSIRQDVRLALEESTLPGGWEIGGDPRKMGQLLLLDRESGMTIRFLKAPYSQPDQIPHAGSNQARRKTWTGRPLQAALPELGQQGSLSSTASFDGETFFVLWAYIDAVDREAGYVLRIVHTRAPGDFGKSTPCDLDLVVPRGGLIGEEDLQFIPSDQDEELFRFDIPNDEEETGAS